MRQPLGQEAVSLMNYRLDAEENEQSENTNYERQPSADLLEHVSI